MNYEKLKNGFIIKSFTNEKFKIPSKLYPLSRKKNIKIFYKDNSKDIRNHKKYKDIENIVNNMTFKVGHCYTNTDNLVAALIKIGIDAKFYSGWVLPILVDTPIHHAWCIIDTKYVLDCTASYIDTLAEIETMKMVNTSNEKMNNSDIKKLYVKILMEMKNGKTNFELSIDNVTTGTYIYVGTEDTADGARLTFNELMNSLDTHPSYLNFGKASNAIGNPSETQEYMKEYKDQY